MWIICDNGNMVNLDCITNIIKDNRGTVCCTQDNEILISDMDVRPTIRVAMESKYKTLEVR
jgi:hypothetical protein